jgi:energy-coupling factor transport system permease protein
MRSPFAYTPRPGPLQAASPAAAVAYLGALAAVAFLYSSPLVLVAVGVGVALAGRLAGARSAVRAAIRLGLAIALPIVLVNALVVNRGETVLARLGDWPLLGQVDVTAEAIADGAIFGLRAVAVMITFAVYSACVDPDRVLRALRPLAARSALTATLVSRLVPVAAADAGRLRDAARLRGPAAAEAGRAPLARRLLAGSLDRAVDVAATLELRGYSLEVPHSPRRHERAGLLRSGRHKSFAFPSRFDRRFYLVGALVLAAAIAAKPLGADDFHAYPTVHVGLGPATVALAALLVVSGLAPLRRRPGRRASVPRSQGLPAPPRGPMAAPAPLPATASRPGQLRGRAGSDRRARAAPSGTPPLGGSGV